MAKLFDTISPHGIRSWLFVCNARIHFIQLPLTICKGYHPSLNRYVCKFVPFSNKFEQNAKWPNPWWNPFTSFRIFFPRDILHSISSKSLNNQFEAPNLDFFIIQEEPSNPSDLYIERNYKKCVFYIGCQLCLR